MSSSLVPENGAYDRFKDLIYKSFAGSCYNHLSLISKYTCKHETAATLWVNKTPTSVLTHKNDIISIISQESDDYVATKHPFSGMLAVGKLRSMFAKIKSGFAGRNTNAACHVCLLLISSPHWPRLTSAFSIQLASCGGVARWDRIR
jgi:hypothetical protein